jgi:phospholipid/cholesterol/gamma-HCH transport system substrate-binding protein
MPLSEAKNECVAFRSADTSQRIDMNRPNIELYVGIFMIIGLLSVGYLITTLGEFSLIPKNRYSVHGFFASAAGLKPGAGVEIAGVQIGEVSTITLDKERLVAKVVLTLDNNMELSEDSIASVKTSGIIGEKYIDILPGGSDVMLEEGDEIDNTESSLDIESLVRKVIFDKKTP